MYFMKKENTEMDRNNSFPKKNGSIYFSDYFMHQKKKGADIPTRARAALWTRGARGLRD